MKINVDLPKVELEDAGAKDAENRRKVSKKSAAKESKVDMYVPRCHYGTACRLNKESHTTGTPPREQVALRVPK